MVIGATTIEDRKKAIARSAAYGVIAHGFRYPDEEWFVLLSDESRWQKWPGWIESLDKDVYQALVAIRLLIADRDAKTATPQLQSSFSSSFGHSVRGACPPYELEYGLGEIVQRASDLADVSGFYAAFGMELGGLVNERPDHVSVEAEFMAVLCTKEAYGIDHGESELCDAVRSAQREFLESHLGQWTPAFLRRVQESQRSGFYLRLADFAIAFLHSECERFEVGLGSPYLELRPADPTAETTQSCGVPNECGQPQGAQFTQLNVAIGKGGQ